MRIISLSIKEILRSSWFVQTLRTTLVRLEKEETRKGNISLPRTEPMRYFLWDNSGIRFSHKQTQYIFWASSGPLDSPNCIPRYELSEIKERACGETDVLFLLNGKDVTGARVAETARAGAEGKPALPGFLQPWLVVAVSACLTVAPLSERASAQFIRFFWLAFFSRVARKRGEQQQCLRRT